MNTTELINKQKKVVIEFSDDDTVLVAEFMNGKFQSHWSTVRITSVVKPAKVSPYLMTIFIADTLNDALQKAIDAKLNERT